MAKLSCPFKIASYLKACLLSLEGARNHPQSYNFGDNIHLTGVGSWDTGDVIQMQMSQTVSLNTCYAT